MEPGFILIRGARQFGKSTWLEESLKKSLIEFGAGSSFYLNADFFRNHDELYSAVSDVASLFPSTAAVRRLFIDEISAVDDWEKAIKKLYDEGTTREILIITTGSKAVDLRRGSERLPGRKGKLDRTSYRFLPVSFREFENKCRGHFKDQTLNAYLMSGGSPIAANELAKSKLVPPYVIELTKDWVFGECSRQNRDPGLLQFLLFSLHQKATTPVSMTKLAKEAGAANNTVVQGYIELMRDLMSLVNCYQTDPHTLRPLPRKATKLHFVNLLAALAFDPDQPWTLDEFSSQNPEKLGKWYEWAVSSHLWRRAAWRGDLSPETQNFWSNDHNEVDFISEIEGWIEVKSGRISPLEFGWFAKSFPKKKLRVISVESEKHTPAFLSHETVEDFLRTME